MNNTNDNNVNNTTHETGAHVQEVETPIVNEHVEHSHIDRIQPVVDRNVHQTHVHKKVEHHTENDTAPTEIDDQCPECQNENPTLVEKVKNAFR